MNRLSGAIPSSLSDLSMNRLSGAIPSSLSDLSDLRHLNLPYNNLSGRIPSGYQLQAFANQTYIHIGNAGLCGPPVSKNCSSGDDDNSSHAPRRGDRDLSKMFFYLGLALGFVARLWLVFCSLLFLKTWRFAYFQAIDKSYDVLYVFAAVELAKRGEKRTTGGNSAD
jgi:hypothetical protein